MAEADRWLDWAAEDLVLAEFALSQGIWRQVCFHSQQAVEKAIKGLLDTRRGEHPRAHSLEALLLYDPAVQRELSAWREACRFLDVFYTITRYPDALPGVGPQGEPSGEDAGRAVQAARSIVAEVRVRMGRAK